MAIPPQAADGSSNANDFTYRPGLRPISISYDPVLLSLTLETLGFDYIQDTLAVVEHDPNSSREPRGPLEVSGGDKLGAFGVPPEARPVTFVLLSYLIAFRQLPIYQKRDYATRIATLVARYTRDYFVVTIRGARGLVPPSDSGLCNGNWPAVETLMENAYGASFDDAEIATRQQIFQYPWALYDVEFITVYRAIQAGSTVGSFPSQAQWNSSIDSTKQILDALGTDGKLLLDTGSALVNTACPLPKSASKLCNALPTGRIVAGAKAADAIAKPAGELIDALANQAKSTYDFFRSQRLDSLKAAYMRDWRRRRYIHRTYTVLGNPNFPKAITLIVPARVEAGQANDPLKADPVVMPDAWVLNPSTAPATEH